MSNKTEVADLFDELTPEVMARFLRMAQRYIVSIEEVRFTPSLETRWTWQGYAKGVAR